MKMKLLVTLAIICLSLSCQLGSDFDRKDNEQTVNREGLGGSYQVSRNLLSMNSGKRPFPQNVGLPSDFTKPNGKLENDLKTYYNMWANLSKNPLSGKLDGYLMRDSYNKGGKKYTIVRADATGAGTGTPSLSSQSEAHGFGMIIMAIMEDNDNTNINEHKEFDSMYNLSRKFRWNGTNLMHWEIPPEGTINNEGPATDGDVTIAYALLLADKQWGTGIGDNGETINYIEEAKKILTDIKKYQIYQQGTGTPWPTLGNNEWLLHASRPSDWMIDVYMEFYKATGDEIFMEVAKNIVRNISSLQSNHAPNTGLVPDFADNSTGSLKPASNTLTGPIGSDEMNEGDFSYNACRVPYRLTRAAALYPNFVVDGVSIKSLVEKMNNWYIKEYPNPTKRNNDPVNYPTTTGWEGIGIAGLTLKGEPLIMEGTTSKVFWSDNCFNSSFAASLMLSGNQSYIDKMYTLTNNFDGWGPHDPGENEYYGYFADTITLLSKIIISGNWWNPSSNITPPLQILVSDKKTALASDFVQGYEPTNINDNNINTIFGVKKGAHNPWIYIDLGKEYLLSEIDILWDDSFYAKQYSIGVSDDGKNWNVYNLSGDGGNDNYPNLTSLGINKRFIGILMTNNSEAYYGIKEFKVYALSR